MQPICVFILTRCSGGQSGGQTRHACGGRRVFAIPLFDIYDVSGGWTQAQKTHFVDGGIFDQIYLREYRVVGFLLCLFGLT
jgi:hypothetical protein